MVAQGLGFAAKELGLSALGLGFAAKEVGLYVEGHFQGEGAPEEQQRRRVPHTKPCMLPLRKAAKKEQGGEQREEDGGVFWGTLIDNALTRTRKESRLRAARRRPAMEDVQMHTYAMEEKNKTAWETRKAMAPKVELSRVQRRQGSLQFDAESLSLNLQLGQATNMLSDWQRQPCRMWMH